MARRRQTGSDGAVNLDSLLDALTNVVAVLILVLVLVRIDVTQKVVELLDNLPPATPEEVAASRKLVEEAEALVRKKETLLTQESPSAEDIEKEKRLLGLLEKDAKLNEELLADLEELRKLNRKLAVERDVEEAETNKLQEEIARLEARLDATPVLEAKPTEVTIPASRPVPENADIYYALVFNQRVHLIDPFTPVEKFMDEFRDHKSDWLLQRISRPGRDRYIYSAPKILEHFKGFDFGNKRGQEITVVHRPTHTRVHLQIKPDPKNGGTGEEELAEPNNRFNKAMMSVAMNRQAVIMFWVHPNSFNTYLLARPYADDNRVPAGWEVRTNQTYWVPLTDFEVRRLQEPPKPDPDAKPKPRPPRLDPTLD